MKGDALSGEDPIEFEVSMGNFGNSLDDTLPPSSCTTPSIYPLFDGNYYHYAPWAECKPCTLLESQWEDVTFRLEALNLLLRIKDKLVCALCS